MQKVWLIFKYDVKSIFTNLTTTIIILGLIFLPSLYAWFNIKANWDPYGATGGIKVAVVNLDKGTVLLDESINVGEKIISALKENNKLGWTFVSASEADYGVKSGKYYASITIPDNFSENLSTLTTSTPVHPELIYLINEKVNAIAPKITSSGATTLKTTVTENIVSTINEVFLSAFNDIGTNIDHNSPQIHQLVQGLLTLSAERDTYLAEWSEYEDMTIATGKTIDRIQAQLPLVEDTLVKINAFAKDGQEVITGSDDVMSEISKALDTSINYIIVFNDNALDFLDTLSSHLEDSSSASSLLNLIKEAVTSADEFSTSLALRLQKLSILLPGQNFDQIIQLLNALHEQFTKAESEINTLIADLAAGKNLSLDSLNGLKETLTAIRSSTQNILDIYHNTISPSLNSALNNADGILSNVAELTNYLESEIPSLRDILMSAKKFTDDAASLFATGNGYLINIFDRLGSLSDKLSFLANGQNLDELIKLLENNPALVASYIASPVILKQESIYAIPNYGSAMTPFYSTLAVWVGIVILTAVLSTHCQHPELEEGLKPLHNYFGKGLFFLMLSLLQTLIIILGDKYLLNVYFDNFIAFLLISLFGALTFTVVIYTLVSVFGNIGKGITIILLVLQISSSGGTFPVEVIPPFFQTINPFLPFTYFIQALREAQGGIVKSNLSHDLTALGIFIIIFICIGVILKPLLNEITHKLSSAFHKSGLGE